MLDKIIDFFLNLLNKSSNTPDIKNHNATFLLNDASGRMMNILSTNISRDVFKGFIQQMKSIGADFVYLYIINEKDGPYTPYSMYINNKIGQELNKNIVSEYEWRMKYIRDNKLGIVLWLRADDSNMFNRTLQPQQEQYQKDVVTLFDKYTSAYVLGLEIDEYMSYESAIHYAMHIKGLTKKHIGIHQKPGKYNYSNSAYINGCWYQYGFNKNALQIEQETRNVVNSTNKLVIATEYHKSSETEEAKQLGDAAIRGGAIGTGNNRHK